MSASAFSSATLAATPPEFRRAVLSPLASAGRTLKRQVVVQGLCRCAVIAVVTAALQASLDKLLVLGAGPRAALLALAVGLFAWQFWKFVLTPAAIDISPLDVASLIERRRGDLRDELISAVAFATCGPSPNESPALVRRVLDDTFKRISELDLRDLFHRGRHRRYLAAGLAGLLLAAAAAWTRPDLVATYVARDLFLRDVPWPSGIRLIPQGFAANRLRWPLGDDLTLVVDAPDKVPQGLRAQFSFEESAPPADAAQPRPVESPAVATGDSTWRATAVREMARRGERQFVVPFGPLQQSMKVRFLIWKLGVDEPTDWYSVDAIERPGVKRMQVRITPPAYADAAPFNLPAGQIAADVLAGSQVHLAADTNKPIVKAALRTAEMLVAPAQIDEQRSVSAGFTPHRSGAYWFDLQDADGLSDLRPVTCMLRLLRDTPPTVRFLLPGAGEMITPAAILQLDVECEDNLGLKSVDLVRRIQRSDVRPGGATSAPSAEPPESTEPLTGLVPKQKRFELKTSWPLSSLSLAPGAMLALQVRAADFQPPAPTTTAAAADVVFASNPLGESVVHTLRVVSPEELMAELARRESQWRREFEQVIKSQQQLNKRCADLADRRAADPSADLASPYAAEQRVQRQQITRIRSIARQFEQILAELRINQLATSAMNRRLQNGIIDPLFSLAATDVPAACDLLERLRTEFRSQDAALLADAQTRILRAMNAIASHMLKWEGFEEAVSLLRDIIRLQNDLNQETQQKLQQQMEELFGGQPASRPAGD